MSQSQTPLRGRPKKLDRNIILQSALMEYWSKGPSNVSINDICKLTEASKPGVYREFTSDDGLKKSALKAYETLAVQPLIDILHLDQPVSKTIDAVIEFITQDRKSINIPNGCLLVMMTTQSDQLGKTTLEELNRIRADLFTAYFEWVERAKFEGGFADIETNIAALFLENQHISAMRMQKEGISNETIANVLSFAFKMAFFKKPEPPFN